MPKRDLSFSSLPPSKKRNISSSLPHPYPLLTQDPLLYDPPLQPWETPTVPYSFLTHVLLTLNSTRSRIAINNTLTNALRTIILRDPSSLLPTLYLLSNSLAPSYVPLQLGLGPSIISRSIQHVSGLSPQSLKRLYNKHGDPGDVAFAAKSNLRTLFPHPPLLVIPLYSSLLSIARAHGQGSANTKLQIVQKLLLSASGEEVRYLVRTLTQNLRVGAVRTSILTALSWATALVPISHFNPNLHLSTLHASPHSLANLHPSNKQIGKSTTHDPVRSEILSVLAAAESLLKRVFVQHPNYDHIVDALLHGGLDGLETRVPLTIGIPLHPTLGSPVRSLDEVYAVIGHRHFTAEFKYDGQRAQIHASVVDGNTSIRIFSRHLEDMTNQYPDVVSMAQFILDMNQELTSFVLDTEIVAIDGNGNLKSFQELSNRPRKDVKLQDIRVFVCVFAFDLMYFNGQVLLRRPFRERRSLLHTNFHPFTSRNKLIARFDHVQHCGSEQGRIAVQSFWGKAVASCCEGVMVKLLDNDSTEGTSANTPKSKKKHLPATYEPDKRTAAWLKLKKDYVTGLGDTLDLVPIGAWHGNGRKASWWSPILLGLWQPDKSRFVAVCKCMSGFTDEFYKSLTERYQLSDESDTCSASPLWECDFGGLVPEVYFKPQEVWEIRGADITVSPVSIAAKGLASSSRGLSVRFPRFLGVRVDKHVEHASTPDFLVNMWEGQQARDSKQVIQPKGGADEGELIDLTESDLDVEEMST